MTSSANAYTTFDAHDLLATIVKLATRATKAAPGRLLANASAPFQGLKAVGFFFLASDLNTVTPPYPQNVLDPWLIISNQRGPAIQSAPPPSSFKPLASAS